MNTSLKTQLVSENYCCSILEFFITHVFTVNKVEVYFMLANGCIKNKHASKLFI